MSIETKVSINPFPVPVEVYVVQKPGLRQDGIRSPITIKVKDLDEATLTALCDQFRSDVFALAAKPEPAEDTIPVSFRR